MATYASLTQPEKDVLLSGMPLYRAMMIQYVKAINAAEEFDVLWTNTMQPVVALLDPAETIPDQNALDAATPLSHDDLITSMADIEAVLGAENNAQHRAYYPRAVGMSNSIKTS